MSDARKQALREEIALKVREYAALSFSAPDFVPGQTAVPPSGKVIGAPELEMMTDAVLDGWLTTGRFNTAFEKRLARYLGRRCVLTTNSGSSANLLAFCALTSPRLGERAILPGDEVIAVAAGFPTTVNPIIQCGAVPVFVDIDIATCNIESSQIEAAIGPRTKAIMLAHTLGNPFDLATVRALCDKYDLWLVEDCCDALGAHYDGKMVGSFGDIGTLSFYPAHHITMGEGGAVFTNKPLLKRIMESFRDWGRDCYCPPGEDNTCGKRFDWQLGDLPVGYDHKYTYAHLGYNLKITDMQAACALAQMDRVDEFIAARRRNFSWLYARLSELSEYLILPEPTPNSDPSWFGFVLTLRDGARHRRADLLPFLDSQGVGTRLLFAGNLLRQPYMQGRTYRTVGDLPVTEKVMCDTFWVGIWPGLGEPQLEHIARSLETFFARIV